MMALKTTVPPCRTTILVILLILQVQRIDNMAVTYVDSRASGFLDGSSAAPYANVIEAVANTPNGGNIQIRGGLYTEKLILRRPMQLGAEGAPATIGSGITSPGFIDLPGGSGGYADDDGDGIIDSCEEALAQRYAPIVYHSSDESNYPCSVDWFLARTSLWFYDDDCTPDLKKIIVSTPSQSALLSWVYEGGCGATDTIHANGTRSMKKQRTFYLADVDEASKAGSFNTQDWVTYYHAYPNDRGGVNLQYWRFYAYNDAGGPFGNHGGDWEGIAVFLGADFTPYQINFMGHTGIERKTPTEVEWENGHPRVYSEGGGHASHPSGGGIFAWGCFGLPWHVVANDSCTSTRQETWNGGTVVWGNNRFGAYAQGQITQGGGLRNIGSKTAPMPGALFIQYSGIWGSPETFFFTSGYWDPAFNETEMASDGFITAWGEAASLDYLKLSREWYPIAASR
jgi:hypothetical protein